ncbi:MAG: 4Fe-4S dicluster domain-containing protein [Prolixibacteraceae bacterium]|nr:4Fe-4S dicluster domain-containing protein [Prolixibacteraceae bacterium]MBN2775399.1 4Fe-4S dicluster domain-containing protein [Prolixibacteraceae bacterium]
MEEVFKYFFIGFWILFLIFILVFTLVSVYENEKRAVKQSLILIVPEILLAMFFIYFNLTDTFYLIGSIVILSVIVLVFSPFKTSESEFEFPEKQFDERDIVFSRNLLKKGTLQYEEYYERNQGFKKTDDLFRSKPGLLSPDAKFFDKKTFQEAKDIFSEIEKFHPFVEIKPQKSISIKINKEKVTKEILKLIKGAGAASCGITLLKPYHLYSHIGRGNDYGKKNTLKHKFAIAFTVEMNKEALGFAPYGPTLVESAKQYMKAAKITLKAAEYIRNIGYEARAHIDANYRVICPLVAQDAGLGTIGRMGLLITPELGPRVRIGVITTDIPLNVSINKLERGIINFCCICKKCADNCPVRAIPFKYPQNVNGVLRWKINSELCFTYWCSIGTDCGICMQVCPYSHPDNFIHNLIRFFIRKNPVNRWLALKLDNFFYGKANKHSENIQI